MAYITKTDLANFYDTHLIVKLSQDDETLDSADIDNADDTVIAAIINSETAMLANYLRHIYSDVEPTSSAGDDIKSLACDLVFTRLYMRKGSIPDWVQQLRKDTINMLEKMASQDSLVIRNDNVKLTPKRPVRE